MSNTNIKCLKNTQTGQLFAYTDEMAQRADMVPYDGPVQTGQSADVLASERTLLENVERTNRKVEALLREQQGHLDQANRSSAAAREQFESENEVLRRRIAELEAGKAESVATPVPAATLAPVPDNMQVVGTQHAQRYEPTEQVPIEQAPTEQAPAQTQESTWAVPEGAEVLEHTTTPVITTSAAPVVAQAPAATPAEAPDNTPVATTAPVAQPVAAPAVAPAPTSVLPASAHGLGLT